MLSDCESPFSVSSASFDQWDGRVAAAGCYEDLFERLRQLDLPNASSKGKFAAPVPDEQSGHTNELIGEDLGTVISIDDPISLE